MKFKHILLVPDSFKGSIGAAEICDILEQAIHRQFPDVRVSSIPVADGGEGTVDCFLRAVGGERRYCTVSGPYFEPMEASYGLLSNGTAVIEMAACAGLPLVGAQRNPLLTTTFGVGQLIAHAAGHMEPSDAGRAKKIVVGLGGSATNDGGTGAMAALGIRFVRENGCAFVPTGGTLREIAAIDPTHLLPALNSCPIITMCDIDNPLCGDSGAARVFAPQKGADSSMVDKLEEGLAHLAALIQRDLGKDILHLSGAGAAGGMGAGMSAFLSSPLQRGIETILDTVCFDALAKGADLVITGEGNLDSQSLRGKVVVGVGRRAARLGIPTVALVGGVSQGMSLDILQPEGVTAVFPISPRPQPLEAAMEWAPENLAFTIDQVLSLLRAFHKRWN